MHRSAFMFPPRLRALLTTFVLLACCGAAAQAQIRGAGSTAAAPVYRVWADSFRAASGSAVAYDAVGSGEGMRRIRAGEVDFGASDVPLAPDEARRQGLVLVPTVVTAAVPVVNLPGVPAGQLHLSGEALAAIYLGQIESWDAAEIRALNPGLALPRLKIRPVARTDASGTTFHFTSYLSEVSPDWKARFGARSTVAWPAGFLPAKGSGEVVRAVQGTSGAIGYVDYNYVLEAGLNAVLLRNASGQFVAAGVNAFRQAVLNSDWNRKGDFASPLVNRGGHDTWPITMGTFIAVPAVSRDGPRTLAALRFLAWGYLHGDELARQARFVPLPERVQASAYRELAGVTDRAGNAIGLQSMGGPAAGAR